MMLFSPVLIEFFLIRKFVWKGKLRLWYMLKSSVFLIDHFQLYVLNARNGFW
jgi:hypothetical protein